MYPKVLTFLVFNKSQNHSMGVFLEPVQSYPAALDTYTLV